MKYAKAFIAIQKYDSYRTASDKSQAMWQGMPTFSIKPTSELPKLKKKIAEIVLDRIAINSEFIEGTPAASAELFPRVIGFSGTSEPSAKICLIEKADENDSSDDNIQGKINARFPNGEAPVELTAQTIDFEAAENNPSKVLNEMFESIPQDAHCRMLVDGSNQFKNARATIEALKGIVQSKGIYAPVLSGPHPWGFGGRRLRD